MFHSSHLLHDLKSDRCQPLSAGCLVYHSLARHDLVAGDTREKDADRWCLTVTSQGLTVSKCQTFIKLKIIRDRVVYGMNMNNMNLKWSGLITWHFIN